MEQQSMSSTGENLHSRLVKLFFTFSGRVGRREFWASIFICFIVNLVSALLGDGIGVLLSLVLLIFALWLGVAIAIKRLHDVDKTGWLTLLMMIPLLNLLVIIWLGCAEGTKGPNRFGLPNSGGTLPL